MKVGAYAGDLAGWQKAIAREYPAANMGTRYTVSPRRITGATAALHCHGQQYVVAKWTPEGGHKPASKGVLLVATTDVEYAPKMRANRRMYYRLVRWATSMPHPTRPAHTSGYDQGQVGWSLHVVFGPERALNRRPYAPALCGMRPAHGWGLDLYIDAPCSRCLAAAIKRGLTLPAPL